VLLDAQTGCLPHLCRAVYLEARLFIFYFLCSAMVAVYGTPVRPYGRYQCPLRWLIRAAMTSLCTSQQALALAGFPTRDYVRCFPGIRAMRSGPMTSPAQRACTVSRAGQHARIVPRKPAPRVPRTEHAACSTWSPAHAPTWEPTCSEFHQHSPTF